VDFYITDGHKQARLELSLHIFAENPVVISYKWKEMKSQTEVLDSTITSLSK